MFVFISHGAILAQSAPCPKAAPIPPHTRSPLNTFHDLWSTLFITVPTPEPCKPASNTMHGPVIDGITYPPNLGSPNGLGYYQMPDPQNGEYEFNGIACPAHRWGQKELIGVIYTVALQWKQKYPGSILNIGDLNAIGHKSHTIGRDVDIFTSDDSATDINKSSYQKERAIELGKMFFDTKLIVFIFFNDADVREAVNSYARQNNLPGEMQSSEGHDNHFHVRLNLNPGPYSEPSC